MNTAMVSTLGGVVALAGVAVGANEYLHRNYVRVDDAVAEKKAVRVVIAQTEKAIQRDVTAVRLQQMRWELADIIARMSAGKSLPGDAARKIELEARIKKLASQ